MSLRCSQRALKWAPNAWSRSLSTPAASSSLAEASRLVRDPAQQKRLAALAETKVEHSRSADEASASEKEFEMSMFRLHNSSMKLTGSIIRAKVISVEKHKLVVDTGLGIGSLSPRDIGEGCIVERAAGLRPTAAAVIPGDILQVLLEYTETPDGGPLVSGQQAAGERRLAAVWAELERRFATGATVQGRVLNQLHGGFAVGIGGLVAFLPQHAATWQTQQRLGELREFRIRSMNSARRNVVVVDARSRGAHLQQPLLREGQQRARDVKREAEALKAALGMSTTSDKASTQQQTVVDVSTPAQ